MLLLLLLTFTLPLRIGFEIEPAGFSLWFDRATDVFWILDILVNFRSHYIDKQGQEVKAPKKVAMNYLRTWFAIDFISSIPFDWFLAHLGETKALKTTKLFKAARVVKILKLSKFSQSVVGLAIEDWFAMNRFSLQLLKLLVTAFLLAHFMSCGWAFMGNLPDKETEPEQAWFHAYSTGGFDWETASSSEQYLLSMYWSITTVTTVGYGDVLPASNAERLYVILAMLVGGAFHGAVIANMGSIVTNMDTNSRLYHEKIDVRTHALHRSCTHACVRACAHAPHRTAPHRIAPHQRRISAASAPHQRRAVPHRSMAPRRAA